MHNHQFVEMVYITGGKGMHVYNQYRYSLREGDVWIIPPDVNHAYNLADHDELTGYNIMFQPALLLQEFSLLADIEAFVDFYYVEPFLRKSRNFESFLRLPSLENLEVRQLIDRIHNEFSRKKSGYRVLVKTQLIELFVYLSRCYQTGQNKPLQAIADDHDMLRKVSEMISSNFMKPLTLEQVSKACGLGTTAFKKKFKRHTGKSFLEFRNEIRIRTAKALLEQTDRKVIDIAMEIGYEDVSFFNRLFKKYTTFSPGDYRKTVRQSSTSAALQIEG